MHIETVAGPSLSVGAGALFLADMKEHLRIDHPDADAEIHGLVQAATRWVEAEADIHVISRTSAIWLNDWPHTSCDPGWWDGVKDGSVSSLSATADTVPLPVKPLLSVDAVDIYDTSGAATRIEPTRYLVHKGLSPVLVCVSGHWPVPGRKVNGIRIEARTGFGGSPNAVPADIAQAIKIAATHLFANKGDMAAPKMPESAQRLLTSYKRRRL